MWFEMIRVFACNRSIERGIDKSTNRVMNEFN